ncbi:MAG TPA: LpxD N-terminal domain-containing protein [Saprospiraceae bacterium]|nr:LpxD N-terminal domain-containing protein [Saprospiraceae bacterium]
MNFEQPISIREVATWINAKIIGNDQLLLTGINEIHKIRSGDITFVDHPKYYSTSLNSAASAIIVPVDMECPNGKALLITEKPFLAYKEIVERFRTNEPLRTKDATQEIHPEAIIEPGAIIGQNVRIGKDSLIQAGAIIRPYTYIGERVTIQSGAIIGAQAFYYKKWPEHYQEWPGCGRVIIENDVSIGAGTTIAQGVSGDTIIGEGTKIDCQVMIGHGVVIGKHCILAAQVGIAGKTIIGDWCTLYGQVGIAQNMHIGDRVVVYAQSGVIQDLEDGKTYFGSPADEARGKFKELAALKSMADAYITNHGK